MIQLEHCSRWYGQVIGLNDVTCEVGPGLTALLGMNGAGKSTLMKLVTGQIKPTSGRVLLFGEEPFANPNVFRRLGYCPEIDNFYEHYTGRQFVHFLARMAGFSEADARERTHLMLEKVGMADRCDRMIGGYSKGMRQRVKLAQAMLHDPSVILLDEPLNGLDPVGRHDFMMLLHALADEGKAILVSSHILYEVEQMTHSILLLHYGQLLASGDLASIRTFLDKHPHQIRIETDDPRAAAGLLAPLPNVLSMRFDPRGDSIELEVNDPNSFYDSLSALVLERGLRIQGFSSPDNNLESVFKYLVTS